MASSRSGSKSRCKAKRRRNLSGSKRNCGINNETTKPEKKKLTAAKIKAHFEKRHQHYTQGLYEDTHVQRVEDTDDEFVPPLTRRPPSKSKKHGRVASSSQNSTEIVQTAQTDTVDAHINLENKMGKGSSHNSCGGKLDKNV
ncbi:hypothetical protein Adt_11292 [Abeliophyllum distichum]|uniref:Uncharacterized protein n=1 Tax=Abeliophyllum distichum TaxID=126358 RepID=A0ABD1UNE5_9LAMI